MFLKLFSKLFGRGKAVKGNAAAAVPGSPSPGLSQNQANNIVMFGIPFKYGQDKDGIECGPAILRQAGIVECLCQAGINVRDEGDLNYCPKLSCDPPPNMLNYDHIVAMAEEASKKQECLTQSGEQILAIGGDHSVSIGTIHGLAKKEKVSLIWIDAHADSNTNISSPTGNVHGMPVALLTKEIFQYFPPLPNMEWFSPVISLKNLAYIGVRSLDPYERKVIESCSIPIYSPNDLQVQGVDRVMCELMKKIDPKNDRKIYVSFDIDGLDPSDAPATGTPVKDGIVLQDAIKIMTFVRNTGRFRGLEIMEFNPSCGSPEEVNKTTKTIFEIIKSAFSSC